MLLRVAPPQVYGSPAWMLPSNLPGLKLISERCLSNPFPQRLRRRTLLKVDAPQYGTFVYGRKTCYCRRGAVYNSRGIRLYVCVESVDYNSILLSLMGPLRTAHCLAYRSRCVLVVREILLQLTFSYCKQQSVRGCTERER